MQGPLLAAVQLETTILNILLFLIIAVAGFGILATFYMIVVEKTRDVGILKALGAPSRGVMSIFLGYGFSLGLVGSGVGLILGLLFVRHINEIAAVLERISGRPVFDPTIYYFREIPTIVEPHTVLGVMFGSVLIAVLASVLPARARRDFIPWRLCAMSRPSPAAPGGSVLVRPARSPGAAPHLRVADPEGNGQSVAQQLVALRLVKELPQREDHHPGAAGRRFQHRPRRVHGRRRPERVGQEHAPAPAGHPGRARPGGSAHFEGIRIDNLPPLQRDRLRNRNLGMIFQFYHLLPELTTLENVLTPIMIAEGIWSYWRRKRAYTARARRLLDMVGLTHRLSHKPRELSGGEMQRAAIARALIASPRCCWPTSRPGTSTARTGRRSWPSCEP
jgi:hypothetical protein